MARTEGVVRTLGTVKKTTGTTRRAQIFKKITATPSEQFVDIALVGDVENELVFRRAEHPVQRDAQLDDAQIGADMAAPTGGDRYDLTAQFSGEPGELIGRKGFDVGGTANAVQ
jgi:hypothetical protein